MDKRGIKDYNAVMISEQRAYAKLNLCLGVLYRRMDGYHALDTLMQSVSLFDSVSVERSRKVEVYITGQQLPAENTITKTLEAYKRETNCGGIVRVIKRIPQEAGMGGGSRDAAAVLRGLQSLHRMLSDKELYRLALSIGADVPFCLRGGLQRAEGIGEMLTPIKGIPLHFVVVQPEKGVSTKELFCRLAMPRPRVLTMRAMAAIGKGDIDALAPLMVNALEDPATDMVPEIGERKAQLLSLGAKAACMTGSGSAVFGLFESEEAAREAAEAIKDARFCAYCSSC